MKVNQTPLLDRSKAETGCCPKFDIKPWDEQQFVFKNKLFVKGKTASFMHMPLNFGSMMKKTWGQIEAAGADSHEFILLSYDASPWSGEHYFSVTKEVLGAENVKLSGTFLTKVFEGPYKDIGKWLKQTEQYIQTKGKEPKKIYFYYTTCPKCAKHYGKNFVVAFAQVL